jgi:hypothetical protein
MCQSIFLLFCFCAQIVTRCNRSEREDVILPYNDSICDFAKLKKNRFKCSKINGLSRFEDQKKVILKNKQF